MIDVGGGCERASIARTKAAWGKFKQLLPLLTSRALPINIRGKVYKSYVRSVMLHGSETWAPTKDTTARLVRNDRAMLRSMYNTKPNQEVSKQKLMEKFNIAPLENMLRANRLSWYGHVERSSGWINRCRSIKVPAPKDLADPRRPGMKLYGAIEKPGNWWMQTHKTAPLGDIGCVKPKTVRLHVWKMRRKPGYVCMYVNTDNMHFHLISFATDHFRQLNWQHNTQS